MRLALLGFGLIGGSVARALRGGAHGESLEVEEIVAWSPSGAGPAAARRDGVIDEVVPAPDAAVAGADLIVLAGPAPDILAQLDELAGPWRGLLRPDAVITDVASTKAAIVERAAALALPFVGGHPMAGREASGYEASTADLFVDRPWVVVPSDDAIAVGRVEALAAATGARPRRMTATDHDEAVAAVSHLPLVVAAALVEAVAGGLDKAREDWPLVAGLAASGWRDMTRLARGDTTMGAGIAVTNGPRIARRIRDLVEVLDSWAADLERAEGLDREAVAGRLRSARDRLEASS
jgi:prephenate dehydrogenase